jgi:lipoprotein-anchoring transpeptidase ErfK/SrfK
MTGWVKRGVLDVFQRVHTQLVVDRGAEQLTLYRNGRLIMQAPVGVGKPSTPTPAGHFWISEAFPSNVIFYGPFAFATTDYSVLSDWPGGGVVGIHGTDQPWLVPGTPSHGCIRLHNSDITRLSGLVPVGTPLLVR